MRRIVYLTVCIFALCVFGTMPVYSQDCPSGTTVGISRNPESCYQCHGSHIITWHNNNIFSNPKPLNTTCYPCHSYVTVPDISCDACHQDHSFGELGINCEVGTWSMTGPMAVARFYNSASLLQDGRFMVAGGSTPPFFMATKTVEILDPATRLFTTVAPLSVTRVSHMQTTLDDGMVLITGGRQNLFGAPGSVAYKTAEIYDPVTNMFMPVAATMNANRRSHRDIQLDDGRVLITGGTSALAGDITSVSLKSAEVYDPATGLFTPVGDMNQARQSHMLVKLLDGRILVVGGGAGPGLANPLSSMEIFDPVTNMFTPAASMSVARMTCAVTLLDDGKVLLAFSWNGSVVTPASELYDPETDTIIPITGKLPYHGKVDNLGVKLYDGTVVIPSGGNANIQVLPDTSVYRPEQDDFIMAGSVQFPRTTGYNTGALLTDGRIVTGGGIGLTAAGAPKFFNNGEIYTPSDIAQAEGLQKLIRSLPASAFNKSPSQQNYLKDKLDQLMGQLNARQYDKAISTLEKNLIPYFDGCAGGNASNDYIKSCDDQEKPYAVAIRIVKTIQEISGVLLPPVLTITATPTSGGKPLAVAFTATATDPDGTVLSYYWDFGDGKNSINQNASNTYTCPGTFTATCAVIDNDGLITQKQVNINVAYPAGVTAEFKCDLYPAYNSFCAKVCHYTNAPYAVGAGVNLSSYAAIMAGKLNSDGTPAYPLVIPGDPDNSPIVQYTEAPRYHAHDVGGERLNDDVREKQRAWILQGAQNN